MALLISGNERGLLDSSLLLLDRQDRSHVGEPGGGESIYVNVNNGNLVIQHTDAYLPSLGEDYALVRTYNSRGRLNDAHQHDAPRWSLSTGVRLEVRQEGGGLSFFEVEYGDGSLFDYRFDAARGLWVSTDGAGAFETIRDLGARGNDVPAYLLTRANGAVLGFDKQGRLLSATDPNGVETRYVYQADRLVQVLDDTGHQINYVYDPKGQLARVTDEREGVLVRYFYHQGRLTQSVDRAGHATVYEYTPNGELKRISLPSRQTVGGMLELHPARQISIEYTKIFWADERPPSSAVTRITNAEGGLTTFEYQSVAATGTGSPFTPGARITRVVDPLGNARAYSNEAVYVAWRTAHGFYATYDARRAATFPSYQAKVEQIRQQHAVTYATQANGYLTEVVDAEGFVTRYSYDAQDNLISITDRNGWGVTQSDSDYYREFRRSLGFVDAAGQGKLVAELSDAERAALLELFTEHRTYDTRGNLLTRSDNEGHTTSFTWTSFDKLATQTSAVGNALVTSDDAESQAKRVELLYAALVADLSAADRAALLALHTTRFEYDARQNVVRRIDPGGDVTRFEYDASGNLTRQIVLLDPSVTDPDDPANAAKVQITRLFYDAFGNVVRTVDGEGHETRSEYDHFGNLVRFTDGRGGVTTYTYDGDDRLLTVTDPEGHVTRHAYDAVGNRIRITDAAGHSVTQIFDRNNLLIATLDPSNDGSANRLTTITYDAVGNQTTITDAEGRTTQYAYDVHRRLIDVETPEVLNGLEQLVRYHDRYAYDAEGNLIALTDRNGEVTRYLHTPNGLLKRVTSALGNVTEYLYDPNRNQLQILIGAQLAPALQRRLRFSFDEEDQQIEEVDALGNATRRSYDAPGNVTSITDANGHTTSFEYDRNDRLVTEIRPQVTDPVTGLPTRYTVLHAYDANGNEVATTNERGQTERFVFDKDDRRVLFTDANGIHTVYRYDSRDHVVEIAVGVEAHVEPDGRVVIDDASQGAVTTRSFDEFGQLVSETDAAGNALVTSDAPLYQRMRVQLDFAAALADLSAADRAALLEQFTRHYAYDRVGNVIGETDHLDRVTRYVRDALDRVQAETRTLGATTIETSFRYDGRDDVVRSLDTLGRSYAYAYDGVGRLTDVTDSKSVRTHYEYDAFGNTTAATEASGTSETRTTRFEYDLENRLLRKIDAEANAEAYAYDAVGNRIRVTDANGGMTQFVYDALDRNVRVIDPLGFETRYEFDGADNLLTIIDPKGGIERLQYDPGNRYVQTTDPEGRVTRLEYDTLGHVVTQRTAVGRPEEQVTRYVYDAEGNLREVLDAEGHVATEDYDPNYNRVATTDGNGNVTRYGYDALDRVIRVTDALGGVRTIAYDAVGNRLSETDERGNARSYEYDENNRLITETDPLGVKTAYAYDAVGNQITITRAVGTPQASSTRFEYDRNDRLVRSIDALGNATRYVYDAKGNATQVIDARGNATLYAYDANDRVVTITDPLGGVTRYAYDGNGNRVRVTDPRGHATTSYYNRDNELALEVDPLGFATEYGYDHNGNVVSERLHATALALPVDPGVRPTPTPSSADQLTTYVYDRLNQVTRRTDALGYATTFTYDRVGNLLSRSQQLSLTTPTLVATTRNAYDGRNDLVRTMTAEGYVTLYQYDAAGNVLSETAFDGKSTPTAGGGVPSTGAGTSRITTFAFDAANRLIETKSPLGTVTRYEYDRVGNRTARIEAFGTALQRRSEVRYDANDRVVETMDALGVVKRTVRDAVGNETAVHEAFGTTSQRTTLYAHDANNRVTEETNALGVKTRTTYDAAGNAIQRVSAVGLPEERTETFEYDARNQLVAQVNGEGHRTEYAYDGAGNQVRMTVAPGRPEQRTNRFGYDLDNRLVAKVDGNGVETAYRYDGADNKLETIQLAAAYDAAGNAVTTYGGLPIAGQDRHTLFSYDLDDRLVSVTDPLGGVTRYEYDALGNQTRITDAGGTVTQNQFDAEGRLVRNHVVAGGHGGVVVENVYDAFGRVVRARQGFADSTDVRQTTYAYDALDRRVLVTEYDRVAALGPTTTFAQAFSTAFVYDVFGNQTLLRHGLYLPQAGDVGYDAAKAARAQPLVASFLYDALDRLVASVDGVNNATVYLLDAFGNRVQQVTGFFTADARSVLYTYDRAGRLVRRVTGEGSRIDFAYDQAGNQVSQTLSGDGAAARVTQYQYDGNGRLIREIDPLGTHTRHVLDAFGNEIETQRAAGTLDERIVRAEFDKNDGRIADVDALGKRTTYQLDPMGNRNEETDALGFVTRLYYDGLNQQIGTLDPEGFLTTFERDAAGNVLATRVYMNRYTPPTNGSMPLPGASDPVRTTTNTYDGSSDLTRRTAPDGIVTESLRNSVGKLIQLTTHPSADAAARARTANLAPRVQTFEYDLAGRLVKFVESDGTIETYAYDTANNRTRQTVTNPSPALPNGTNDPVRTVVSTYDLDNRLIAQTTDPGGLALTERLAYDAGGHVIRKTDARGNVITASYDAAGRLVSVKDPLGNETRFAYDRVGNQAAVTDPRGHTTNLEYDKSDRLVKEIGPAVDVFTIDGGLVTGVRPMVETKYDAVGNVVQVKDENGFLTTYWYDGNRNTVAQVNGDDALRTYTHDATGAQLSASLYMTRVSASAHAPAVRPTPPTTGEVRTVRGEYDAAGRSIRTIYPQISVTTLSGTATNDPTATTALTTPDERNLYDAFGDRVESFDRGGNRSLAYHDARGRIVATIDAAGYLTESSYDDQGNLVRQKKYATPLNLATLSPAVRPTAPSGDVAIVDRIYDTANRLLEERSPEVQLDGSRERVATRHAYDANGNTVRRTFAAGTSEAATEHSYYDAADRLVALVTAGRALITFGYDAAGNRTLLKRFANLVPTSLDLGTATLAQVLASVTTDAANDQESAIAHDALGRQTSFTDRMGPGAADDIVASTAYDAAGNATQRTDPLGNATLIRYDALRHATETRSPDGNRSFVRYDAAGLKVEAWTGDLGGVLATVPTGVAARVGSDLEISFSVTGSDLRSYVVYDTSPHDTPSQYANQSARAGSGDVSVHVPLTGFAPGTTLFFRAVSVDVAGSTAWTAEQQITVPARPSAITVARSGADLQVRVRFDGAVTTPVLRYGPEGGTLGSSANLLLQADGSYLATIAAPSDPQALAYQIAWSSGGTALETDPLAFEAPGDHEAVGSIVTIEVPDLAGGTDAIAAVDGGRVDEARTNDIVQFPVGSLAAGSHVYEVYYGDPSASDHTLTLTQHDHQVATPGTPFDITGGRRRTFTWAHNYEAHVSAALSAAEAAAVSGSLRLEVRAVGATGSFSQAAMSRSGDTWSVAAALSPGSYDLRITYVDTSGRSVIVAWRRLDVASATLPPSFNQDDTTLPFDFAGLPGSFTNDVTVNTASQTGRSRTVTASETDGTLTKPASGAITLDPGLYLGAVDPDDAPVDLAPATNTGSAGEGQQATDGRAGGYFTETLYDAIGHKIATNEDDGVWRRLDVDANGNAVRTRSFGTRQAEAQGQTPIVTFTAFDARGLEIAEFGAKVAVDTNADGTNDASLRAVTRLTYDYDRRLASRLAPFPGALAVQHQYDGAGNLVRQTDALGHATLMAYDRRGREVKRTDPLGHVRRMQYDAGGRMVKETDALGEETLFTYDAFDRVTRLTDPLGHAATASWDQHDRLVRETDANGFSTTYTWDKRDQLVWTQDENGHFFGHAYDVMGRVTHRYSFQGASPTSLAAALDAVANPSSPLRPFLVDDATAYDIYGNKASETDAMGRRRTFEYGAFGQLVGQTDEGGRVYRFEYDRFGRQTRETRTNDGSTRDAKDIRRTYDEAGRLTQAKDHSTDVVTSGVTTDATYDVAGRRAHEKLTAHPLDTAGQVVALASVRDVTYGYDATGRMTSWSDSVTGKNLAYQYDAAGNQRFVTGTGTNHEYRYDANDRITEIRVGGALQQEYTYDDAGNRRTHAIGGVTTTYTYDAGDRLTGASSSSGSSSWQYDRAGNVTNYTELDSGGGTKYAQTNSYTENDRQLTSDTVDNRSSDEDDHSHTTTTNQLDRSGRLLRLTSVNKTDPDDPHTSVFSYSYTADGREGSVTNISEQNNSESSSSQYDANDGLFHLSLGQGEEQEGTEFKRFVRNSEGQIFARYHDDGEADTTNTTLTQYLYANGHIVGEVGNDTNSAPGSNNITLLDRDQYNLVKNINDEFPGASATGSYVVQPGDTLQAIAARLYGNPSLWFVIADANGLTGTEALKAGTRLEIPLRIEQGRVTADTHVVYQESEIVGSTLPNLKAPPMSAEDTCLLVTAIILIIVVAIAAVVLTVVTVGVAAPAAAAALGFAGSAAATIIAGVVIGAAVGATLGFVAGVITQGILIGFGLQDEFDWKAVAADTVAGAIGGIAAGISAGVSLAARIGQIGTRIGLLIRLGVETALNVAGEVTSQVIQYSGRIEQPWMIGVAAAGGIAGELLSEFGGRAFRAVKRALGRSTDAASDAARAGGKLVRFVEADGTVTSKLSKDVGFEAVDDFSPLKAVDTKFTPAGSQGKISLSVKNAGEIFEAGGKTHALKPATWSDDAAGTVSGVQSPVKLDVAANPKAIAALSELNAGSTGKFTKRTVVDFAEGTVGKVADKTVPIDEAVGAVTAPAPKKLAAQADEAVAAPRALDVSARKPPKAPKVTPKEVLREIEERAVKDAGTPEKQAQAVETFESTIKSVFKDEDRALQKLLKADAKQLRKAKVKTPVQDPSLPRYNDVADADLPTLRQQLKAKVGQQRYDAELQKIRQAQLANPKLRDVDPEDVLGVRFYTFEPSAPADAPIYDVTFKGLNNPLRGVSGKLQDADPFIRLTARGLDLMPKYQGTTFRGFVESNDATRKIIENAKEGAILTEKAFTSSSVSPKTAIQFASGGKDPGVVFVVNTRRGPYVNPIHATGAEFEVVHPPNTQFRVLKVVEVDRSTVSPTNPVLGKTKPIDVGRIHKIIYIDELLTA